MKNKRRLAIISLALCITLALTLFTACGGKTGEKADEDYIYIGVTAGITGDAPLEGEGISQACQLAVELINEKGGVLGGKKLALVIEDDKYTAEGAIAVANKFAADERIVAIAGPGRSNCMVAISDIIKEAGIPIVTPATSTAFYDLDNPYIFRDRTTDGIISDIATRYMIEKLGVKKLGIMATNDDNGVAGVEVMKNALADMGVTNAEVTLYNKGEIDYSGIVLQMRDAGVDGLVLWGHTTDYAVITRNMYDLGYDVPTIGNTGFMSATYLDLVDDEVADGLYICTDTNVQSDDEYMKWFRELYIERWGVEKVDITDAIHFAHVWVIADAIERAGSTDREAIAEAMRQTKDLESCVGPLTCDEKQDLAHSAVIFRNENKTAVAIDTLTIE